MIKSKRVILGVLGVLVYGEFVLIYGIPKRFHFGSSQARF